jgi:hypothetical protein
VVEVVVREEDRVELRQPDRPQQLLLRPLPAVEQHAVAACAQQERGQAAPRGGHGARGAGEEQGKIHRTAHLRSCAGARRAGAAREETPLASSSWDVTARAA